MAVRQRAAAWVVLGEVLPLVTTVLPSCLDKRVGVAAAIRGSNFGMCEGGISMQFCADHTGFFSCRECGMAGAVSTSSVIMDTMLIPRHTRTHAALLLLLLLLLLPLRASVDPDVSPQVHSGFWSPHSPFPFQPPEHPCFT